MYNLQKHLDDIDVKLETQLKTLQRTVVRDASQVQNRQEDIQLALDQLSTGVDVASTKNSACLASISEQMASLTTSMDVFKHALLEARSTHAVLSSLAFEKFQARYERISKAHENTYTWAFEDNIEGTHGPMPLHFARWMRRKNGIYWVRGKAGSGKSTFMKFISRHSRMFALLKEWAGGHKLVVCKYFFWNAGTALQKSQEGLLRSVLFDILKQCRELIPLAEENMGERQFLSTEHDGLWSTSALLKTCRHILSQQLSVKFCLFIDGLDEYEGESDDLIATVQSLAENSHVKLCVSSRPWIEFVDAFGEDPERLLKLEDLTARDIRLYVHDTLWSYRRYRRLAAMDGSVLVLEEEVLQRSQGVFLWVYLVVRSLLEGARYVDSIQLLQQRLRRFPRDLKPFFDHMLRGVSEIYRVQTAKTFRRIMVATAPMVVQVYYFVDRIEENPQYALDLKARKWTKNEIEEVADVMTARIDGWTKGLLEVVDNGSSEPVSQRYTVEYLHRTVRDFIESSREMQQMFSAAAGADFLPAEGLCHALLAVMKTTEEDHRILEPTSLDILFHCSVYRDDKGTSKPLHPVLDHLGETIWGERWRKDIDCQDLMCEAAVDYGLVEYLGELLSEMPAKTTGRRLPYLMELATAPPTTSTRHEIRRREKPAVLAYLKSL